MATSADHASGMVVPCCKFFLKALNRVTLSRDCQMDPCIGGDICRLIGGQVDTNIDG